jgi:hypothetical protein
MCTDCELTTQEINRPDEGVLREGEKDAAFRDVINSRMRGLCLV